MSKKRQLEHLKSTIDMDFPVRVARPEREIGRARDFIAEKAGFSSDKQYERSEVIAKKAPELGVLEYDSADARRVQAIED